MKKVILIVPLLFGLGCDLIGWDVEYKVSGSGGIFDVTISNEDDGTSQFDDVNSGWSYSFRTDDSNHFLYVSAQNQNDSGSVTTEIHIDGKKKKSSTSTGAYVIASCSMSAGD